MQKNKQLMLVLYPFLFTTGFSTVPKVVVFGRFLNHQEYGSCTNIVVSDLDTSATFLNKRESKEIKLRLHSLKLAVFCPKRKPDHLPSSSIFNRRTVSFREGNHPLVANLIEDIPIGKKRESRTNSVELAN